MVTFPPLAPSITWCSNFFSALSDSGDVGFAIQGANRCIGSPKEFGRFILSDSKADTKILSVAVEGGGRQLRSFNNIDHLHLSEHGDWRRIHLSAMEALWGSKPFYRFIAPSFKMVYEDKNLSSLKDFNTAIFGTILSFLMGNLEFRDLASFYNDSNVLARGRELATELQLNVSVLQALTLYGRETLLGILATALH